MLYRKFFVLTNDEVELHPVNAVFDLNFANDFALLGNNARTIQRAVMYSSAACTSYPEGVIYFSQSGTSPYFHLPFVMTN